MAQNDLDKEDMPFTPIEGKDGRDYTKVDDFRDIGSIRVYMEKNKLLEMIELIWAKKTGPETDEGFMFSSSKSVKTDILDKVGIESATYHRYIRELVKKGLLQYTSTKGLYVLKIRGEETDESKV